MKTVITILLALLISISLIAQPSTGITGTILDSEEEIPLFDAHIYIEGTDIGTTPDRGGNFYIEIPEAYKDRKILVSHVGYTTYEAELNTLATQFNCVLLKPAITILDEVVVFGNREPGTELAAAIGPASMTGSRKMMSKYTPDLFRKDRDYNIMTVVDNEVENGLISRND
jgi:hypothetical protein